MSIPSAPHLNAQSNPRYTTAGFWLVVLLAFTACAHAQPYAGGSATRSSSAITTSPGGISSQTSSTSSSGPSRNSNSPNSTPPPQYQPAYSTNSSSSSTNSSPSQNSPSAPLPIATDPAYRLSLGDEVVIDVHGESDMSTAQRIDQQGNVRVPHLNEVSLANKTVREAEAFLEQLYIEKKLLKKPLVNINVREYSSRQVTIIGAVNSPGIFHLPREADSIEIVELITSLGGFRPTAKSDSVRVTHTDETGQERVTTVDVEAMIYNRRNAPKSFRVYPGDRILVIERIW